MNFTESLNRKMEEVERPPLPPVGHYIMQVVSQPELDLIESARTGKEYDKVLFPVEVVSACDDVDQDELSEFGNVQGIRLRKEFLFSRAEEDKQSYARSEYQMRQFLAEHLGLDAEMSFSEAFPASVGAQFIGELIHRPDPNDPEIIYAELGRKTTSV